MKKLFLSVLAIAGLVACVQEEVLTSAPNLNDGTAIAFGDAIVDNSVRAEINDPSFTNESLQEFTVWAYVDESKGLVLKDEKVYKNPSWTYDNTQYWVKGHNYRFFAVAPRHSANVAIAALQQEDGNLNNNPYENGLGNITFTNVNGTEDLLYASLSKSTAESIPTKVQFEFDHILSKVKFSFTNGFEASNYSVVVTDVKMYVPSVATINLNAQGDYTSAEHHWVLADGETTELSFGHIQKGENVAKGTKAYTDNERLTIPAGADQKYKVTFKVELYSGEIKLSEANKTTYIEGCELLPGHAYNFTATLSAKNVSDDGDEEGLQAIVFEAGVKDWDEGGEYDGGVIATNMVANETELAAALAKGGLVTLANDLALTAPLTVAKGVETTIDLNGHNMSIVDETNKSFALLTNAGNLTIKGEGTMTTKANVNSGWNRYSSVVSNSVGGTLTVGEGVVIEHLGGTDMAYGIDNLTNGKGTYAVTNIESGATVKSTYSAVRQFLNGVEATNELYVKSGAVLESPNRAIFFQDPSKNPNTGKLVVEAGAKVTGKVYLSFTEGSTEWPVEVSVASSALQNGSVVAWSAVIPAAYEVVEVDGVWVVREKEFYTDGESTIVKSAAGLQAALSDETVLADGNIKLGADIVLPTTRAIVSNWTAIGTSEKPFSGTFDGNGYSIKNLQLVEAEAKEGKAYIGFFGYAKDATIKNVTFENVYINIPCLDIDHSQGHIGAVAGSLEGTSTIENVTVKGDIKVYATQNANGASRVAVVAGGNSYGYVTMKNVHVVANEGSYLTANNNTGALAGQLQGKMVFENCSSNIDVTVNKFFAGGLVGIAAGDSYFKNCHTTGDVAVVAGREGRANDHYRVGGIAGGWADGATKVCTLENCSYTGQVSGTNADGSVAETLDYFGYVGRGYTLSNCEGSTVIVNGTEFVQVGNTAPYGVYTINGCTPVSTADELVATLAAGEGVYLLNDITIAATKGGYDKAGILQNKAQTIDGGGHTLTVTGAGATWDCAIYTNGGTIRNLIVKGAMRGIFTAGQSSDLHIDNVEFKNVIYTFNSDGKMPANPFGVYVSNSKVNGWTSHSNMHTEVVYTNCSFGEGSGYKYCRPYGKTEFVNCTFCAGYNVDKSMTNDITFTGCTWE